MVAATGWAVVIGILDATPALGPSITMTCGSVLVAVGWVRSHPRRRIEGRGFEIELTGSTRDLKKDENHG
jgi:hypothetical protein